MSPDVLVIGGGVSGLCAAVDLASRGYTVHLAEQHQHLGGRVHSFTDRKTGDDVDNGQHLLMGCYSSTLEYLRTVGTIDLLSLQSSLDISFRSPTTTHHLHAPTLPAPFHVLAALLRLDSLSLMDRLSILRIVPALLTAKPGRDERLRMMTVDQWLTHLGQGEAVKKNLWNILSIGTLNERPDVASAAMFVTVLQTVFLGSRRDTSVALPRRGLSRLFGDGGAAYLLSHGGRVLLHARAKDVRVDDGIVRSVMLGETRIEPRAVVSAVPYHAMADLFSCDARAALPALDRLDAFTPVPIVSIHLWYDTHFMDEEFSALLGSPIDWVFNKSMTAGKGRTGLMYLSLVISAAREQCSRSKEELVQMADSEVRRYYSDAGAAVLVHARVIKEKRATFSPRSDSDGSRAAHASGVKNLFIAGDWSDTHLPATIEGAAQSGYACAALADRYLGSAS